MGGVYLIKKMWVVVHWSSSSSCEKSAKKVIFTKTSINFKWNKKIVS